MMRCPSCHAVIPEDSKFCNHCGATLNLSTNGGFDEKALAHSEHKQLVDAVSELLAGKNCGSCGYATCAENAEAIVLGKASYDSCVGADAKAHDQIRQLLGIQPQLPWTTSLWKLLTSVRLAIGLILALALVAMIGTLVPQNGQPLDYVQKYGLQGYQWIHALQFDRLFQSWYFLSLLLALSINTACCTIKRSRVSFGLLARPMPERSATELQRLDYALTLPLGSSSATEALERARQTLQKARFRVAQTGSKLRVYKHRFGRLGVDLLHMSLIVVLLGALAGAMTSFEDFQVAHQDEVFEVAQGGFSIRVDGLWSESYAGSGQIKDWYTTLTVLEGEREVFTQTIEVNQPLTYKGISFYQSSFGSDWWGKGKFSVQLSRTEDGTDLGTFELESNGSFYVPEIDRDFSVVTFMPDFAVDENLQSFNRSQRLNNPALYLEMRTSDGTTDHLWAFARSEMRRLYQTHWATDQPYQANLVGFAAEQFTGLRVASNPAIPLIYAGFVFMGIGLFLNFYWPPRWAWATVEGNKLYVGAVGRDAQEFDGEFHHIATQLGSQFETVDTVEVEEGKEIAYVD